MNHNTGEIRPAAMGGIETRRPDRKADMVDLAGAAAVDRALDATPDIRPEAVARARKLIGDPAYPPRETIVRLSHLLALHLPAE